MPCVWQGQLQSVYWPHSETPLVDLEVELWGDCLGVKLEIHRLVFDSYVCIREVPMWGLAGNELQLMTKSDKTLEFFSQFAQIKGTVALKLTSQVLGETKDSKTDQHISFVVYAFEDTDHQSRIAGRFVDYTVKLELPVKPVVQPHSVFDVKAAVSQTVMGALRLRGVRRTSPDFKKIYYAMHSLVSISLRNVDPARINAELLRDKVEQLWTIIEN